MAAIVRLRAADRSGARCAMGRLTLSQELPASSATIALTTRSSCARAVAVELMAETVQAAWPQWHVAEAQNHQQLRGITCGRRAGSPRPGDGEAEGERRTRCGKCDDFGALTLRAGPLPAAFVLRKEPLDPPQGPSLIASRAGQHTDQGILRSALLPWSQLSSARSRHGMGQDGSGRRDSSRRARLELAGCPRIFSPAFWTPPCRLAVLDAAYAEQLRSAYPGGPHRAV